MSQALLIVAILMLSACNQVKNTNLYNTYEAYLETRRLNKEEIVVSMLSGELRKRVFALGKEEFPIIAGFPETLSEVISHYQLIESDKGCLSINGYNKSQSPITLNIEYLFENNQWLLSFVEIYYLDTTKDYADKGICPAKD